MKFHPLRFGQRSIVKGQLLKEKVFSALVYVLLFLYNLYPYRDYDWGWHYRLGEYFFKHGQIMWGDIFSWSMQGYVWVNHEWLYDPLLYVLYSFTGFFGLSVAGAAVAVLIFYFATHRFKLKFWELGILAIFYYQLTTGVFWQGLRSQMIGILLVILLIDIFIWISRTNRLKPYIMLPFFFLLWANLHGTFTIGILFFTIFLILQYIPYTRQLKTPKELEYLSVSYLISVLFSFVNPYGFNVYLEAIKHASSPLLPYILEWLPVQFPSNFYFLFLAYSVILVLLFLIRRKRSDIFYLIVTLLFFYLSLGARRYVAIYVSASLVYAAFAISSFRLPLERYRITTFLFIAALIICAEIAIFQRLPGYKTYKFTNYSFQDYCDFGSSCSEGLTFYLKAHPPKGKGLNYYDWGGYLIGRGVPTKLFIDGRMHLWRADNGFEPFLDYQKMYYEKDIQKFATYDFDWIIADANASIIYEMSKAKAEDIGQWVVKYRDDKAFYAVRKR